VKETKRLTRAAKVLFVSLLIAGENVTSDGAATPFAQTSIHVTTWLWLCSLSTSIQCHHDRHGALTHTLHPFLARVYAYAQSVVTLLGDSSCAVYEDESRFELCRRQHLRPHLADDLRPVQARRQEGGLLALAVKCRPLYRF